MLHCRPISATVHQGINSIETTLGKCGCPFSQVVSIAGLVITVPLALAETVAALALAIFVGVLHLLGTPSETLQKHILVDLSYSLHSFAVLFSSILLAFKTRSVHSHTFYTMMDHGLHLGSAAVVQLSIGNWFDHLSGRIVPGQPLPCIARSVQLLSQDQTQIIDDFVSSMQSDLGSRLQDRRIGNWEQFLQRHPDYQPLISNFSFAQLADPAYYRNVLQIMGSFFQDLGAVRATPENPLCLELNHLNMNERSYQRELVQFIRLGIEAKGVCQRIENYIQFLELNAQEVSCPPRFESETLAECASRPTTIRLLRDEVLRLSPEAKDELIRKLMNGDLSDPLSGKIQDLAKQITYGPLLRKTALNLETQSLTHAHLFQEALG